MAVLAEAISVIVKGDSVKAKMLGGLDEFFRLVPNGTLCYDEELLRIGFMNPYDVEHFIGQLTERGLRFLEEGEAVDIAVVDQLRGPTTKVGWLEFGKLAFGGDPQKKVSLCWLFEGPRRGCGLHFIEKSMNVAMPTGWVYENSLSANFQFIQEEHLEENYLFLRHEDGLDVYLNKTTGEEVFISRRSKD